MPVYLTGLCWRHTEELRCEQNESPTRDRGHRLDKGRACLRFKKFDNIALDVIGATA